VPFARENSVPGRLKFSKIREFNAIFNSVEFSTTTAVRAVPRSIGHFCRYMVTAAAARMPAHDTHGGQHMEEAFQSHIEHC